ncbi:hypothetical protein Dsin_024884 [Dipteronia sinensis]|uniref:Non-haem dioxygenase N-terminal domain-containing protein n=1 Tax=Dipteronia sinensis TaxID=43782 RepID=A0AAD9ZVX5_9ROSI|nr:hypothetical protein Dsin_024884 [Dipteronia sinensis]
MDKLVSIWSKDQSLPENYIFPPENRPGKFADAPPSDTIPVIDLSKTVDNRADTIQQILQASKEFGFFQVINHGVSEKLINDSMRMFEELHGTRQVYTPRTKIISSNKLKSVEHRAVTNSKKARTSAAIFITPASDSILEPAKALIDASNPPIYKAFEYKDFLNNYTIMAGNPEKSLQPYKLQA